MALRSTVFKLELDVADMDRGYYGSHTLTVARHPSETDERMMLRVLALALNACEGLEFGGGVSTPEEPDLWYRNLSGEIEHWIDLGRPDERRVRKACGRAHAVTLYTYGGGKASMWWAQNGESLSRCENLRVFNVPLDQSDGLASLVRRTMAIQCNIQDGEVWMIQDDDSAHIVPELLFGAG